MIAGDILRSPLGSEQFKVCFQPLPRIQTQLLKRAIAEMMYVHVQSNQQAITRFPRPHAQIVVLKKAHAITLVQPAQASQHLAADKQAEAG